MKILVSLLLVLVFFSAAFATSCVTDSDCGSDECCFNHQGPLIVSRRQLEKFDLGLHTGVCERYKKEGDHCNPFDKLNGPCSCGAGLQCGFVPLPSTTATPSIRNRRKLYFPGPWSYQCGTYRLPYSLLSDRFSFDMSRVCERYKKEGDHCNPFDKLNGHCSCGAGLQCGFVSLPSTTTTSSIRNRRRLYLPGPGSYQCKTDK